MEKALVARCAPEIALAQVSGASQKLAMSLRRRSLAALFALTLPGCGLSAGLYSLLDSAEEGAQANDWLLAALLFGLRRLPPGTRTPQYIDLGGSLDAGTGASPDVVVDSQANRLLVFAHDDDGGGAGNLVVHICTLDGQSCRFRRLSFSNNGRSPSAAFDPQSQQFLIATRDVTNNNQAALFRCDRELNNCTISDLNNGNSAGNGSGGGPTTDSGPALAVDSTGGTVYVSTANEASETLGVFRCSVFGGTCSFTNIAAAAGVGASGYRRPDALIDQQSQRLTVAASDAGGRLAIFRCTLDMGACFYRNASAGEPNNSGFSPSIAQHPISRTLYVAAENMDKISRPSLYICSHDGSPDGLSCIHRDISAGQSFNSGYYPSLALDLEFGFVLTVAQNVSSLDTPSLFRCDLNGEGCTHTDLRATAGISSGFFPDAAIDPIGSYLLVAAEHRGDNAEPALYRN